MGVNTTHHLRMYGVTVDLDAARCGWLDDGPFSKRAAAEFVRERPDGPSDRLTHAERPDLWISFEGPGPQIETVADFAAGHPALTLDFIRYDPDINAGEHHRYEAGGGSFMQEFDYASGYEYVYGEPDPLLAGDSDETVDDDADDDQEGHEIRRNQAVAAFDKMIRGADLHIANLTQLLDDLQRQRDLYISVRSGLV
ncbi:hypothetical protein [Falsiroseomonas sp. HW251]|uniref:hypothetical protein n=1 Tax=Falsiroseomonas sp. HW251 TaxID=3390998 RepID=UPI003D310210